MDLLACIDKKFWQQGRLETFTNWPFKNDVPCNPHAMASAGFFSSGGDDEPDLAECFLCGKQMDGWESTDDPWEEHKSHQADCHYIILNKREESEWTIEEMFELLRIYVRKMSERKLNGLRQKIGGEIKQTTSEIPKLLQKHRKNRK